MRDTVLVTDVDGTLVKKGRPVSIQNRSALERLRDAGVFLVLASGRPMKSLREFQRELSLEAAVVASNGNHISDEAGSFERVVEVFPASSLLELRALAHKLGVVDVYTLKNGSNLAATDPNDVLVLLDQYNEDPPKWVDFAEIVELGGGVTHVHLICPTGWKMVPHARESTILGSVPEFMTATPSGVTKGTGLRMLLSHTAKLLSRIVVIGDGANDLPMFELANLAIALAGGNADLLPYASVVAPTLEDDGFAWAVENVVLRETQGRQNCDGNERRIQ